MASYRLGNRKVRYKCEGETVILPVTHACKVPLISEHSLHDQGLWLVTHHPSTEEEEEREGEHVDCEAGRELLICLSMRPPVLRPHLQGWILCPRSSLSTGIIFSPASSHLQFLPL